MAGSRPRKSSKTVATGASSGASPQQTPKKFSFKKASCAAAAFATSPARSAGSVKKSIKEKKLSKAKFELHAATYQTGDSKGRLTGAVYIRACPKWRENDDMKKETQKYLLGETWRWNDVLKAYTVKVYTKKQAQNILNALAVLRTKSRARRLAIA